MGIFAAMREHPGVSIAGWTVVIVGVAVWLVIFMHSGPPTNVDVSTGAWFSTDDGKTWFKDDQKKLPPFDHDGNPAYRAYVFDCDNGKGPFVAYLERYTPEAQQQLHQMQTAKRPPELGALQRIMTSGVEVKEPGGEWMPATDPRAIKLKKPTCPGNPNQKPKPVLP